MRKSIIVGSVLVIASVLGLVFIHFANDHVECEQKTETVVHANGTKVTTNKHICKEKYNL